MMMQWFPISSFVTLAFLLQTCCTSVLATEPEIMAPGIHVPPSKVTTLSGLLSPRGMARRQFVRCEFAGDTLCPGDDFCCQPGSVCQPFNREFGQNCCPDTAFSCNDGQSCCGPGLHCCSFSQSSTGCCQGAGPPPPPPPPPPPTHTTTKTTPRPPTRTPTPTTTPTPDNTTTKAPATPTPIPTSSDDDSGFNTETDIDTDTFFAPPSLSTPLFTPVGTFRPGTSSILGFPDLSTSLPSAARGRDKGGSLMVVGLSVVVAAVFF